MADFRAGVLIKADGARVFRHVPVVEDEQIACIVPIGDVLKTRIAETVFEAKPLRTSIVTGRALRMHRKIKYWCLEFALIYSSRNP